VWYSLHMVAPAAKALDRILDPFAHCLNSESARRLVQFQLDDETKNRIDELAQKANQGLLTETENSEYHDYVEAMDLIGIFQAKARQILMRPTGS
jgi:hypothetical protein